MIKGCMENAKCISGLPHWQQLQGHIWFPVSFSYSNYQLNISQLSQTLMPTEIFFSYFFFFTSISPCLKIITISFSTIFLKTELLLILHFKIQCDILCFICAQRPTFIHLLSVDMGQNSSSEYKIKGYKNSSYWLKAADMLKA